MISNPARELKLLEDRVLTGRAFQTLTEEEEDALLGQMDALWAQLPQSERDRANLRAERIAAVLAPETLGLEDRFVPRDSHERPRMAV